MGKIFVAQTAEHRYKLELKSQNEVNKILLVQDSCLVIIIFYIRFDRSSTHKFVGAGSPAIAGLARTCPVLPYSANSAMAHPAWVYPILPGSALPHTALFAPVRSC